MERKLKSKAKISLIIPIYNTEKYLGRCLESAVGQTYSNMEIIGVDDGSTDGSGKILDQFAAKYNRIIAVHQKNAGESGARNTGLRITSGDYVGFMDCDDWIEPDMYEKLVQTLEENDADMVAAGWFRETDAESIPMRNKGQVQKGVFKQDELLKYIYKRDEYQAFAYMWNKLYKRKLLYNENGEMILFREDLRLGGDVLYLAQLAMNTQRAVYVDRCFYHYLQRDDSGCHSVNVEKRMDWIRAYEIVIDLMEKRKISDDILIWVKRFMAYHCSNVAEIAYQQGDLLNLRKCQKFMRQYENEYINTNLKFKDRIDRYQNILALENK